MPDFSLNLCFDRSHFGETENEKYVCDFPLLLKKEKEKPTNFMHLWLKMSSTMYEKLVNIDFGITLNNSFKFPFCPRPWNLFV